MPSALLEQDHLAGLTELVRFEAIQIRWRTVVMNKHNCEALANVNSGTSRVTIEHLAGKWYLLIGHYRVDIDLPIIFCPFCGERLEAENELS